MPCIRIKQMDERVATMGLHMGGPPERKKLEPGEIVFIPDDVEENGENLFDLLWDTDKIEMYPGKPTRPFEFANVSEAKLCSPEFRPHDESEKVLMHKTREAVRARLLEEFGEDKPKTKRSRKKTAAQDSQAASRRALRRQALEGGSTDGENTPAR